MSLNVVYGLAGAEGPCELGKVGYLRVRYPSAHYLLDVFLAACSAVYISPAAVLKVVALYGITEIIAEKGDIGSVACVELHCTLAVSQRGISACPALAVKNDIGIDSVKSLVYLVHGLDIVKTHKVKAEAVYLKLGSPVNKAVDDVFSHHEALGGYLISAARAVGEILAVLAPKAVVILVEYLVEG